MPSPLPASLRDPSTLFYQSNAVKRSIIISYWTVILLAVPLWWYATSIQRLALPTSRILSYAQRHLELPVAICIEDASIRSNLQGFFDVKLRDDPGHWRGIQLRVHGENDCR